MSDRHKEHFSWLCQLNSIDKNSDNFFNKTYTTISVIGTIVMVQLTILEQVTKFVQTRPWVACFCQKFLLLFWSICLSVFFVDIIDKGVVDMKAEETA